MSSSDETYNVRLNKKPKKQILEALDKPYIYSPLNFGLSKDLTGKDVRISIIDTGCPNHKDIETSRIEICSDMNSSQKNDCKDAHGHSTMISGVLAANNPSSLVGISPQASLLYAKVAHDNGKCSYNAVIASVLWSVVKQVDVILISLGSKSDHPILHDAIKKAYDSGICVVSASSNNKEDILDFPSSYPEVLSIYKQENSKVKKFTSLGSNGVQVVGPFDSLYTTYLNNKYTKTNGNSILASLSAGLVCLLIERAKSKQKKWTPASIYSEFLSLSYRP